MAGEWQRSMNHWEVRNDGENKQEIMNQGGMIGELKCRIGVRTLEVFNKVVFVDYLTYDKDVFVLEIMFGTIFSSYLIKS